MTHIIYTILSCIYLCAWSVVYLWKEYRKCPKELLCRLQSVDMHRMHTRISEVVHIKAYQLWEGANSSAKRIQDCDYFRQITEATTSKFRNFRLGKSNSNHIEGYPPPSKKGEKSQRSLLKLRLNKMYYHLLVNSSWRNHKLRTAFWHIKSQPRRIQKLTIIHIFQTIPRLS